MRAAAAQNSNSHVVLVEMRVRGKAEESGSLPFREQLLPRHESADTVSFPYTVLIKL